MLNGSMVVKGFLLKQGTGLPIQVTKSRGISALRLMKGMLIYGTERYR